MGAKIKLICFDVDGTLTDGKIYMGAQGECMKAFHVKDGYAINHLLPLHDILPVIITGRKSEIVKVRCEELHIRHIYQGVTDKTKVFADLLEHLNIGAEATAYFGDDLNDLDTMKLCGIVGCPADACKEILEIADFISPYKGGEGAARSFIEWLLNDI